MDLTDGQAWAESFKRFFDSFRGYFKRSETRQSAQDYIRGLLSEIPRKTCWQIAEVMGEAHPDGIQRMLYGAGMDEAGLCRQLRAELMAKIGYEPGIGVIDESGMVKKGRASVGVKRQYCGHVGKVENCQVGVFLGYVAPRGHALLDREIYLPEDWCEDALRRTKAKVPEAVTFQTKPELALRMLQRAWGEGVLMQWVVGDSGYGNSPTLRTAIANAERYYVLEMPKTARVSVDGATFQTVETLAATWPVQAWERIAFNLGEQGLRWYDWAAVRVQSATDDLGDQWLLVRRSVSDPADLTYYLSNAPAHTPRSILAQVAASRFHIEHLLEEAKDNVGLDHYEVRSWPSWYRHMTLVLMAHAWLTLLRHADAQKKSPPTSRLAFHQLR